MYGGHLTGAGLLKPNRRHRRCLRSGWSHESIKGKRLTAETDTCDRHENGVTSDPVVHEGGHLLSRIKKKVLQGITRLF